MASIFETDLPQVELVARGKVRDIYAAGDFLVIVATDRLSAFDYVLPTPIRDKGKVLTALTIFWLEQLRDIVPNHFVSANVSDYPPEFHAYRDQLEGRSMLVHRAKMIDVECVARGYCLLYTSQVVGIVPQRTDNWQRHCVWNGDAVLVRGGA